ncbi:MAG: Nif3-like dinuclear metal center hexameric protein [Clostridia bacterium]|nr:Nif3-like dinuclear metal center hexameric protein [Clostridia bacterium]
MKLSEFYKLLDRFAPKALSDAFCASHGAYDNSGILVDVGAEITGVIFSLDLSSAAIRRAKETGKNLVVTHHPAIYAKLGNLCVESGRDPLKTGDKLMECIKNGISVISMHLNLDGAAGGTDESLMQGVLRAATCVAGKAIEAEPEIMITLAAGEAKGGYGRSYSVPECDLDGLVDAIKQEFSTERVSVYKNGKTAVKKAASFCGAGGDEEGLAFAVKTKADVLISSDFKHHVLAAAKEQGIAVIALTHYASEAYGFEKYYDKIRRQTELPCELFTDTELL